MNFLLASWCPHIQCLVLVVKGYALEISGLRWIAALNQNIRLPTGFGPQAPYLFLYLDLPAQLLNTLPELVSQEIIPPASRSIKHIFWHPGVLLTIPLRTEAAVKSFMGKLNESGDLLIIS